MDFNKHKLLRSINYKIKHACGTCEYSDLNGDWGICKKHKYKHEKHTDQNRQMSVHRYGSCGDHRMMHFEFGRFEEFVEE